MALSLDKPPSFLVKVSELNHSTEVWNPRQTPHLHGLLVRVVKGHRPWARLDLGGLPPIRTSVLTTTNSKVIAMTRLKSTNGRRLLKVYCVPGTELLSLLFNPHNMLMRVDAVIISNVHLET